MFTFTFTPFILICIALLLLLLLFTLIPLYVFIYSINLISSYICILCLGNIQCWHYSNVAYHRGPSAQQLQELLEEEFEFLRVLEENL